MGRRRRGGARAFAALIVATIASAVACAAVAFASPAGAATGGSSSGASSVGIDIQAAGFNPATASVPAGSVVVWTNRDNAVHTVTAVDGSFASEDLPAGATFPFQFTQPGTFQYRDIHSGHTGTVIVVATTAASAPVTAVPSAANPAGGPTMAFTGSGDWWLAAIGVALLALGTTIVFRQTPVAARVTIDTETALVIERARRCRREFLPGRRRRSARSLSRRRGG